jgi:putative SOS response-associated peptidase YedK
MLTWGLIPSWSTDGKGFINARAETLEEKPSFSESFRWRRCLIPADGFPNGSEREERSVLTTFIRLTIDL